jgi:hypothetical protein
MYYPDLRKYILNGDLISFRGTGLQSLLFRYWGSDAWWPPRIEDLPSHVAIAVWMRLTVPGRDRLCVVESVKRGVRMVPLSGLLARYPGRIFWHGLAADPWLDRDEDKRDRLAQAALALWDLGLEYPTWKQHFVTGFGLVRGIRRWMRLPMDLDLHAVMCSEFVAQVCIDAGFDSDGTPACLFGPRDVTRIPWFLPGVELLKAASEKR